jgi:hypothetical protein
MSLPKLNRQIILPVVALVVTSGWGIKPAQADTIQFTVALEETISTNSAHPGDKVRAKLIEDLKDGQVLIAPKGSLVVGKITEVDRKRRLISSELPSKRWLRASGGMRIEFDEIITTGGAKSHAGSKARTLNISAHPLSVSPAAQHNTQEPNAQPVTVAKDGNIESTRKPDMKPKAARSALGLVAIVAAPVSAVVGGVAGAVKPSTVLPEAEGDNEKKHRHLKGFATGVVAGLPGGFLVNDSVLKGHEAVIPAGSQLLLEWTKP